ncbi:MAG: pyridoxal phosphate-dependent aminotransferase [Candidatus Hecatellales archaeon]|nr:MAG: pyridoxal phosphate-dependent aminotransferase [Candidatus Hecatellales archaeon]
MVFELSRKVGVIKVSGIRKLFELASKMEDVINLGLGEPDFNTPEYIKEAAKRALDENFTHYTPNIGIPELREAIAEKLKRENRVDVNPESEVMVTNGATQALTLSILAILNEGDEVLIPSPTFVSYGAAVIFAGGVPVEVETREDEEFRVNVDELERHVSGKTKALIISTPNNPTGSILTRGNLEELADFAVKHDLIVISDEVYEKIVYEEPHCSIASLNGMKERTITVNAFSKTYAMTGWRLGYLAAPEQIVSEIVKLQMYTAVCATSFAQKAAVEALRGPQSFVEEMRREYARRRELVYSRLNDMPKISAIKPKGAFYVFPNIKATEMVSEKFSSYLIREARVATVPGRAFGRYGEGYIRISYAASYEKLEEAMDRISEALNRLS